MCWKLSPFVVSFYGEYEQTAKADGRYLLVNIVKEKGKNLMKHIYLNLKRFDVPVEFGGVNRLAPVADWASCIVKNTQEELKTYDPTEVEFGMYFPEVHLLNAVAAKTEGSPVQIGCQSVFRADTAVGGNFGAFTTNRPASAMVAAGCETTIIGHCEERNDKAGILAEAGVTDTDAVNRLLNQEIKCAIERGMKVLYCIGEKSEEQEQWQEVLGKQLEIGLKDVDTSKVVIAYEPIWSIGPGKTPAGKEYITKIAKFVKEKTNGMDIVYGGGLKQDNAEMLAPKEVGKRIKERRHEIGISMPELGRRVGVNKSTIQRYETDGVNPNRSMIINGLADALQTTPEWLTGRSEEKEVKETGDSRTVCEGEILDHLSDFLDAVAKTVQPEVQQRFLTSMLCLLIDLFSITAQHYGRTLNEIDRLTGDEALKKSIQQYTIHVDDIIVPVYRREMEAPIEDMKRFLDGLLHIFDKGRTRVDTAYLYNILHDAQVRLNAADDSVAP